MPTLDSDVAVANEALTLVGAEAITALTQAADRARAIQRVYEPALDAMLRRHDWNFARLRVALARLSAAPAFGYSYQYQLPQEPYCLRVLGTNLDADTEPWEIETYVSGASQYRVIVTDATSLTIRYIGRITDPTRWDAGFADAFVYELARRIAYALTGKVELVTELTARAAEAWAAARSVNGQEARPLARLLSQSFTTVR